MIKSVTDLFNTESFIMAQMSFSQDVLDHKSPCGNQMKLSRQQSLDSSHSDSQYCESENPVNQISHMEEPLHKLKKTSLDEVRES